MGRENYPTWKFAMRTYLEHEELWEAVEGTEKDAKKVNKARTKICLCVDPINYVHIQDCKDAKSVWESLENVFDDSGLTRRIGLLRLLISTRLENCDSVEEFVNTIISTCHKLNGIGFKVDEEWIGSILLAGLSEEYKPMIMGLESSGMKITGDSIKTKILQDVKMDESKSNALIANKGVFSKKKSSVKHTWKPTCFNCQEEGHITKQCPKRSNNVKKSSLCAVSEGFVNPNAWYLDSGATSHMSRNRNWIRDMKVCNNTVNIANNRQVKVRGQGFCEVRVKCENFQKDLDIKDVSYVPDLSTNLLSISKITEKGNTVVFSKNECKIFDSANHVIATGIVDGGLYKLREFKQHCMVTSGASSKSNRKSVEMKKQKICCWFCEKAGHFKRDCYKFKAWKKKKQNGFSKVVKNEKAKSNVENEAHKKQYVTFDLSSDEVGDMDVSVSSENDENPRDNVSETTSDTEIISESSEINEELNKSNESTEESESIAELTDDNRDDDVENETLIKLNPVEVLMEIKDRKSSRTKKKPQRNRQL